MAREEFQSWLSLGRGEASIRELSLLMRADHAGRPPLPADCPAGLRWILHWAEEAGVLDGPMKAILRGRDLIERGLTPSEEFSRILEVARKAQRDRLVRTRDDALRWLDQYLARTYPLITAQDLIDRGLSPGPTLGRILKEARDLQSRRELRTRDDALKWLESRLAGEARSGRPRG